MIDPVEDVVRDMGHTIRKVVWQSVQIQKNIPTQQNSPGMATTEIKLAIYMATRSII